MATKKSRKPRTAKPTLPDDVREAILTETARLQLNLMSVMRELLPDGQSNRLLGSLAAIARSIGAIQAALPAVKS